MATTTPVTNRLKKLLDEGRIPHEVLHHAKDYTALETAYDTGTPGPEFAKAVVLNADGVHVMAVVPASHRVDLDRMRRAIGAREVTLVDEERLSRLFPDCEVGAEPPFGRLWGLPVFASFDLAAERDITFNAGTHRDAIRMRFEDYRAAAQPTLADISVPR